MRVTFLISTPDMSGGIRVLAMYASMLRAGGHEVYLVAPGPVKVSMSQKLKTLLRRGRVTSPLPVEPSHFDEMGLTVHRLECSRPIVDADVPDADFVIATWWETAEWSALLGPAKGKKVYLIQHHEVFDYVPVHRVRATYRMEMHKIVVAGWLQDVMAKEYGDTQVDLVSNAVDHQQFDAPPRSRQTVPTVGLMYSVTSFKAIHVAVEAIRQLKALVPELKVICFSHQPPEGLDLLGPDLESHTSPSQDVIRDCYSRCDAWLSSSESEGFNLPALEAMACRTPVVSTRTGWPATAIVDGYNGYGAAVGDAEALCLGAMKVLRADNWERLSQNAYETAAALTWENSYELFIEALEKARRRTYS